MASDELDLDSLLIRTQGMSLLEARRLAREYYEKYCVRSEIRTHDCQRVWFHSNRFDHAFSRDAACRGGTKDEIDLLRVERLHWIPELVGGRIRSSVCRSVMDKDPNRGSSRLYMIDSECYVVWLLPRDDGDWAFSTAYKAYTYQMKKYRDLGPIIWKGKWK